LLPGISGLTFPPKSTQGLTAAVENLLSYDASQRCVMGKKGREHIEAVFDRKLVVSAYLEEIQKTI
jgi:galacturonosyltransferase